MFYGIVSTSSCAVPQSFIHLWIRLMDSLCLKFYIDIFRPVDVQRHGYLPIPFAPYGLAR